MENKRILIVYHSERGNTMFMAYNIGHGAENSGVEVVITEVEKCKPASMVEFDGVIIGSPTFFSNMSWQVKKFIDESASLRTEDYLLDGKVGGAFTSSAIQNDGRECLRMIMLAIGLHHKMKIIPGIVVESKDTEDHTAKICQEYGEKIARKVLAER
jgi:NAD(P)H dehydrogenase (quinone)